MHMEEEVRSYHKWSLEVHVEKQAHFTLLVQVPPLFRLVVLYKMDDDRMEGQTCLAFKMAVEVATAPNRQLAVWDYEWDMCDVFMTCYLCVPPPGD